MRLAATPACAAVDGFLRSRGDAPVARACVVDPSPVPPLARRCAFLERFLSATNNGSSARAEMRPIASMAHALDLGFLRSRGDAPCTSASGAFLNSVPPLARRCAAAHAFDPVVGSGSSARAEMRPCAPLSAVLGSWFLRSRGDAPHVASPTAGSSAVPPLARRCASWCARLRPRAAGSSARAEMRPARPLT